MAHILRVPPIDLTALLNSDTPSVDLNLDRLNATRHKFRKTVTRFKNQVISEETDARMAHATEKKRIAEKVHDAEIETNQCKIREVELVKELAQEAEERKEAETSVSAFKRQLASLQEKCAALDSEIEHYQAITNNLERERKREQDLLLANATAAQPDINILERALACVIEGLEANQLLIRFWFIDPHRPEREFTFVLDVGSTYKVVTSSPPISTLPVLVDKLNATKDIYWFIPAMRQAFVDLVST